jgi:tetratricopeptide (TPR) repeat protein
MGDINSAISDFDRAIELDSENAFAYYKRAGVYLKKDDCDQAIADFDSAIEIDPEYALAYLFRGICLGEIGWKELAIADLEKAIELGLKSEQQELAESILADNQ